MTKQSAKQAAINDIKADLKKQHVSFISFIPELNSSIDEIVKQYSKAQKHLKK